MKTNRDITKEGLCAPARKRVSVGRREGAAFPLNMQMISSGGGRGGAERASQTLPAFRAANQERDDGVISGPAPSGRKREDEVTSSLERKMEGRKMRILWSHLLNAITKGKNDPSIYITIKHPYHC
ncbi:uncharacterized protein LOC100559701 isoform X2 [Anolis carolinensis]|uniref:uncharacterized protein LOC100559701 isoform X2 n=1 Tax=Anolis carolinensis TaxID=28377 RepID=UPI002F2B8F10